MAINLLSNTSIGSASPTTTTGIDTTGATLLIVTISLGVTTTTSIVDSKGNTWVQLFSPFLTQIYYSYNKAGSALSVGAGHTVTVTDSGDYPFITFAAFSGTKTTSTDPLSQQSSTIAGAGSTSVQPGSITDTAGSLFITSCYASLSVTAPTINSSFNLIGSSGLVNGVNFAGAGAYKLSTTENPIWSLSNPSASPAAVMATFLAGGGIFTTTLSDVISVLDMFKWAISIQKSDVFSLIDVIKRNITTKWADTVTVIDAVKRGITVKWAEVLSLVDRFYQPISLVFSDIFSILDSIHFNYGVGYIEAALTYFRNYMTDLSSTPSYAAASAPEIPDVVPDVNVTYWREYLGKV